MFITLEGGEGCGKTTQAQFIKKYLEKKDHKVLLTREPGGTPIGKVIRTLILENKEIGPEAELLLILADRLEHVAKVIQPALAEGKIVISDRFSDSTLAYQVGARGLQKEKVDQLTKILNLSLSPDCTFLFDLDPREGLKRIKSTRAKMTVFEEEEMSFHIKVRQAFLDLAQGNKRFHVISTSGSIPQTQEEIARILDTII